MNQISEIMMNMIKLIGAGLALTLSTAAFAAQGMDCCKEMKSCCCKKDGEKPGCCEKMKQEKQDVLGDGHADHDMSPEPKN
jgi:hypothetical protein